MKIDARPNPILETRPDPAANIDAIQKTTHRTELAMKRRSIRDLRRKQTAAEAIDGLDKTTEIFGLTKGQFSLIDLLEAALEITGPAEMSVSTWTAANTDVTRVLEFIDAGRITGARWLVDLTFTRRTPQLAARIRQAFGPDAIRVTHNHAKFSLLTNDTWSIVIRTSMNLNFNPRLENFTIAHDPDLSAFLHGMFADVWKTQSKKLADKRPCDVRRWFGENG